MDSDLMTGGSTPWLVALTAVLLGVAGLACTVAMMRSRVRSRRALEQVLAQTEDLRAEVDDLRRSARPAEQAGETTGVPYVITGVGADEPVRAATPATRPASPDGRIGGRLFADLVLRESVVRAAALAHGVHRALAPEARNRIRFEMGRELKRARRQRRSDLREARRRVQAEQRAGAGGPRDDAAVRHQGAA